MVSFSFSSFFILQTRDTSSVVTDMYIFMTDYKVKPISNHVKPIFGCLYDTTLIFIIGGVYFEISIYKKLTPSLPHFSLLLSSKKTYNRSNEINRKQPSSDIALFEHDSNPSRRIEMYRRRIRQQQ